MDLISGAIFLILFVLIMIIVFSIGLTSNNVGRKEITFIIIIGFILGGLGGYFFIEPIYEETPYLVGNVYGLFSTEDESINIILPTSSNVSDISSEISKHEGVNSVTTSGFDLKVDSYTNSQSVIIKDHLESLPEIKSYSLSNNFISVDLVEESQTTATLGTLVSWLSQNGISSEFAFIHLKVNVNPMHVTDVKNYLKEEGYKVGSVEGPVQDIINGLSTSLVSEWIIVGICGLIGVLIAILGIKGDSLASFVRKRKSKKMKRDKFNRRY